MNQKELSTTATLFIYWVSLSSPDWPQFAISALPLPPKSEMTSISPPLPPSQMTDAWTVGGTSFGVLFPDVILQLPMTGTVAYAVYHTERLWL